jgi:hypothetical protein
MPERKVYRLVHLENGRKIIESFGDDKEYMKAWIKSKKPLILRATEYIFQGDKMISFREIIKEVQNED